MDFKDYYKILGVKSSADKKEIKAAYRKLARKYHPDVSEQHDAEDRFKEMTEAYNVLKDASKRAEYDELRKYGGQHGQAFHPPPGWQPSAGAGAAGGAEFYQGDFSEFFETLFGDAGRARRPQQADFRGFSQRGSDIELEMPILLEDTVSGYSDSIAYNLPHYDSTGQRLQDVSKKLKVTIPAGVTEGESVRLKGQGAPGIGDGESGDLYLRIRLVPHPLFDVEGHNLTITVPVAPWEAALGAALTVPTLHGSIKLKIPANSQSGKRLRIKGRGLVGKSAKGNLYAVVRIVIPEQANPKSRELWEQLAEKSAFDPRSEWRQYQ